MLCKLMRTVVLNSRQSKTPVVTDEWVANTIAAVIHASEIKEAEIVSSIGLITWDLVTWQTGELGVTLDLVVPRTGKGGEEEITESILRDYALVPDRVRWHFIDVPPSSAKAKSWWSERDQRVIELAELALPVSIRPYGQLNELLCSTAFTGKIDRQFQIPYQPRPHHPRKLVEIDRLNPALHDWPKDFLIHWTRACHGPWPGETRASFFEDLVQSGNRYCRSAFTTLERIVRERKIRASSWRIAGDRPAVAFTELAPIESLPLMRWRARWARWSFEPYGIAVHRDWAISRGVRPVRYVTESKWRAQSSEERLFCHRIGQKAGEWPAEREWRCLGDFSLTDAPTDALRVIVQHGAETALLPEVQGTPIIAFVL